MTSAPRTSARKTKRPFTLVEILVVVAIFVLTASSIGIALYRAVEMTRFEASVEAIKSKLRVAYELSRLARIQVKVFITKKSSDYFVSLDCDLLPAKTAIKNWWAKPQRLDGIESIIGKSDGNTANETIQILIDPLSMFESFDKIEITPRVGNKSPYILLPASFLNPESQKDLQKESHDLFPQDLQDQTEKKAVDKSSSIEPEKALPAS